VGSAQSAICCFRQRTRGLIGEPLCASYCASRASRSSPRRIPVGRHARAARASHVPFLPGHGREAIRRRTRDNLAQLRVAVVDSGASLLDVEGGWCGERRAKSHALALLEKNDVYVHPGHFFDYEEEAYIVLSLLMPEETLREGVRRILERVREEG
jgi:hypothetical protein